MPTRPPEPDPLPPAIAATALSKRYPTARALDELTLSVHPGEIYGLVGRNGAGKTTLMRLLLGLLTPTSGSGRVLGRPLGDPAALARVGSLVEAPAFYPHLSGRDNLRLLAHYCRASTAEVDAALDRVGLGDRARSRYGTYSLGMKQRLGVGSALLGDPELLILDEPTNGLDPGAAVRMRDLLAELRDHGRTILLSSHLLGEIEQVCDRVGIVHDGRLVVEGTVEQLRAAVGGQASLVVRAEPVAAALTLLRDCTGVCGAAVTADGIEVTLDGATAAEINRKLVGAGIEVSELRGRRESLEQLFLGITEPGPARPDPARNGHAGRHLGVHR